MAFESAGQVITVYKKGSLVAASKGSFRSGKLKAVQNKKDWIMWASKAAIYDEDSEGGSEDGIGQGDPIHKAILEAQVSVWGHAGDPDTIVRIFIAPSHPSRR